MSYYTQNASLTPENLVSMRISGRFPITSHEYFNTYGKEIRLEEAKQQNKKFETKVEKEKKGGAFPIAAAASIGIPIAASIIGPMLQPLIDKGLNWVGDKISSKLGHGPEFDSYMAKLKDFKDRGSEMIKPEEEILKENSPYNMYHVIRKHGKGIMRKMTDHVFGEGPYSMKMYKTLINRLLPRKKFIHHLKKHGKGIFAKGDPSAELQLGEITQPVVSYLMKKIIPGKTNYMPQVMEIFKKLWAFEESKLPLTKVLANGGSPEGAIGDLAVKSIGSLSTSLMPLARTLFNKYFTAENIGKVISPLTGKIASRVAEKVYGHGDAETGVENKQGVVGYGYRDDYEEEEMDDYEEEEEEEEERPRPRPKKKAPKKNAKRGGAKSLFALL